MRILFEGYQYPAEKVKGILDGITRLRDVNDKISVNYVGYYYNPTLEDCVFILPKVLLEDVNGQRRLSAIAFLRTSSIWRRPKGLRKRRRSSSTSSPCGSIAPSWFTTIRTVTMAS